MAVSGRNLAIDTDEAQLFDSDADGIRPTTIVIRNRAISSDDALIRIPELHGDSGFATIIPGDFQPFRIDDRGFTAMFASCPSSTASIDFWFAAVTRQR